MDTTVNLYEAINVWRRTPEQGLVCYRCFRNLRSNKYVVQSSDSYSSAVDNIRARFLEEQYLDLLRAENPDARSPSFNSLEEAIQAHDVAFSASGG
jgi:hypothetical protein